MAAIAEVIRNNERFETLGDQLFAVKRAAETGGRVIDRRLEEIQRRATTATQPAGASEMIPSDGGFLVAPEFSQSLVTRIYDVGMLLKRMMKFSVKRSNAIAFPQTAEVSRVRGARLGGIQVYPENEAQSIQVISPGTLSQKPSFSLSTITMNKYTGLLYCTDELAMETSAFSTWAEYCYSMEMAFQIEQDAVLGTGAGELEGVINSPALIAVPAQVSQPAASVTYLNVLDMVGSLWSASKNQKTAIWLYNEALLPTLMALTIPVGNAGSELQLWHFSEDDTQYDTLCGIPAFPSEYCAAPGSLGDIILADWSRYALATREVRADSSIHVLFLQNESTFRFISRVGGHLVDIAPVLSANGSTYTSTAIALAAR